MFEVQNIKTFKINGSISIIISSLYNFSIIISKNLLIGEMAMTLRLLFHNINRALCHSSFKHVANSNNSDMKEVNESARDWKLELHNTMKVYPNFISETEEDILMKEIDPYMKRLRYEYSHWDNVSKI